MAHLGQTCNSFTTSNRSNIKGGDFTKQLPPHRREGFQTVAQFFQATNGGLFGKKSSHDKAQTTTGSNCAATPCNPPWQDDVRGRRYRTLDLQARCRSARCRDQPHELNTRACAHALARTRARTHARALSLPLPPSPSPSPSQSPTYLSSPSPFFSFPPSVGSAVRGIARGQAARIRGCGQTSMRSRLVGAS